MLIRVTKPDLWPNTLRAQSVEIDPNCSHRMLLTSKKLIVSKTSFAEVLSVSSLQNEKLTTTASFLMYLANACRWQQLPMSVLSSNCMQLFAKLFYI